MKRLILFAFVMMATAAWAGGALQSDGVPNTANRTKIQGFAPNGRNSQALTVNKTTGIDLSSSSAYAAYSPADCVYKIQSTATVVGINHTLPGGQRLVNVVHERSPYVSYSGCTGGQFQRD